MLGDILGEQLDVVFCGTAVATASANRGHYYAGRGNEFWQLLHRAGFTATQLGPDDDTTLPSLGIGLTDLVKGVAQSHDRGLDFSTARDLEHRLAASEPRWVGFTSLKAGSEAARAFGEPKLRHGERSWRIGGARALYFPAPAALHATPRHGMASRPSLPGGQGFSKRPR